ncbi:MAG: protein-L-isoaspartate O-methyltransferase [Planctomycetota bacterium]|nr:MAG: protein-L-isoaspartate O-methyltransferase [Planctomycetota bacterium]
MCEDLPADRRRRQRLLRSLAGCIHDPRIAAALQAIPRHYFVPDIVRAQAYDDTALPIGSGQTISQPQVIVLMLEALGVEPGMRVLDVGTGSGYAAALLSYLTGATGVVHSVEFHADLLTQARRSLAHFGASAADHGRTAAGDAHAPVHLHQATSTIGLPEHAPYQIIHVACAAQAVPEDLCQQLAVGGRMVCPIHHGPQEQRLLLISKQADGKFEHKDLGGVLFVPLLSP